MLSTVLVDVGVQERNAYVHQASIGEYESVMTAPPPKHVTLTERFN